MDPPRVDYITTTKKEGNETLYIFHGIKDILSTPKR